MPEAQVSTSLFTRTFDAALLLADGVAVISTATTTIGQVALTPKIVDLGAGYVRGTMIVDVQALDVSSGNELYTVVLQGADDAGFGATRIICAMVPIGHQSVNLGGASSAVGRYEVPFTNMPFRATGVGSGIPKRYVRAAVVSTGTTPSFDWMAYLVIDP